MKTSRQPQGTILVLSMTFVSGIFCSLAGCGGTPLDDLPDCQSPVGATIDTETCVDFQQMALCKWDAPGSGAVVGCVTSTRSSSGDEPGIECVQACPPNHYDTSR
jgi:hypothetical protein